MRCTNIELHLKIPINIDKPDGNGVVYTEEVVKNACDKASNQPIITYNEKGEHVVIGFANTIKYENGKILVDGYTYAGGTTENVLINDNKEITSMEILNLGLCN